MINNTKEVGVEVGDRVVCDGLQTSQFGKVIGVGSDEHSIKLLINGEERYEPDYCLLEVTAKNKRAVELLLIHFKQIIAERDREVMKTNKITIRQSDGGIHTIILEEGEEILTLTHTNNPNV